MIEKIHRQRFVFVLVGAFVFVGLIAYAIRHQSRQGPDPVTWEQLDNRGKGSGG